MKKSIKNTILIVCLIVATLFLIAGIYCLYVVFQYSRIEDNTELTTDNNQQTIVNSDREYTIATYNIGFGAYGQEFSFFMDKGVMEDGREVVGKYGKSISKEKTLENTLGAIEVLRNLDSDIILLQEVDLVSSRTRGINQGNLIKENFSQYSYTYSSNFHTAYLFYPFHDPHGKTEAGLVTLSKLKIVDSTRRSYPVPAGFSKFFDLDRCFTIHRLPVDNGKELVVINSHMSAYDEGGKIREEQLQLLCSVMEDEYKKGNYVIVGGDFNHILGEELVNIFPTKQQIPQWIAVLSESLLPQGFSLAKADNHNEVPTCRAADIPWEKGVNYTAIVDGFIISDNIEWESTNIETDFMWSDHQPVLMKFKLK